MLERLFPLLYRERKKSALASSESETERKKGIKGGELIVIPFLNKEGFFFPQNKPIVSISLIHTYIFCSQLVLTVFRPKHSAVKSSKLLALFPSGLTFVNFYITFFNVVYFLDNYENNKLSI
jgi:hypothetical protein